MEHPTSIMDRYLHPRSRKMTQRLELGHVERASYYTQFDGVETGDSPAIRPRLQR